MNSTTRTHGHHHRLNHPSTFFGHLLARWPAVLGLLALLTNTADGAESHVVAMIIITATVCYVGAAALGFRRAGWIMVGISSVVIVVTALLGLDQILALLVLGTALAVVGFLRGPVIDRREHALQVIGFIAFSGLALIAMMSAPALAMVLAAAVAIGHAVWDVVYFVRDTVVDRSLTEACFVLDLGLGVALLLTAGNVLPLQ